MGSYARISAALDLYLCVLWWDCDVCALHCARRACCEQDRRLAGDVHPSFTAVRFIRSIHVGLDILFDLQALVIPDEPYDAISGYRSPGTNALQLR